MLVRNKMRELRCLILETQRQTDDEQFSVIIVYTYDRPSTKILLSQKSYPTKPEIEINLFRRLHTSTLV